MLDTLKTTLEAVRDENLSLLMVEKLRDTLIHLRTDLKKEEARLKKQRALFFFTRKELSKTAIDIEWDASKEGLELIDVKGALGGLSGEIDSLQSRIYSLIR